MSNGGSGKQCLVFRPSAHQGPIRRATLQRASRRPMPAPVPPPAACCPAPRPLAGGWGCAAGGRALALVVCKNSERNPRTAHSFTMQWNHITDHDLERYYLGMVKDETELSALEEHLLACGSCAKRAEQAQDYVDAMRAAGLDFIDPYAGRH